MINWLDAGIIYTALTYWNWKELFSPSFSYQHVSFCSTAIRILWELIMGISVVLFTRAYAVWGGARHIFVLLAIVYTVRLHLSLLRVSFVTMALFQGAIAGSSYSLFLFLRGVSAPRSSNLFDGLFVPAKQLNILKHSKSLVHVYTCLETAICG